MANPIQIVSLAPKPNSRLNCSSVGTGRAPVTCSTITVISNAIPTSRPTPIDIQNRNTSELERGTLAASLDLVLRLGLALALGSAFALARVTSHSSLGAFGCGLPCSPRVCRLVKHSSASYRRSFADHCVIMRRPNSPVRAVGTRHHALSRSSHRCAPPGSSAWGASGGPSAAVAVRLAVAINRSATDPETMAGARVRTRGASGLFASAGAASTSYRR
jgi:hypothetical protein